MFARAVEPAPPDAAQLGNPPASFLFQSRFVLFFHSVLLPRIRLSSSSPPHHRTAPAHSLSFCVCVLRPAHFALTRTRTRMISAIFITTRTHRYGYGNPSNAKTIPTINQRERESGHGQAQFEKVGAIPFSPNSESEHTERIRKRAQAHTSLSVCIPSSSSSALNSSANLFYLSIRPRY